MNGAEEALLRAQQARRDAPMGEESQKGVWEEALYRKATEESFPPREYSTKTGHSTWETYPELPDAEDLGRMQEAAKLGYPEAKYQLALYYLFEENHTKKIPARKPQEGDATEKRQPEAEKQLPKTEGLRPETEQWKSASFLEKNEYPKENVLRKEKEREIPNQRAAGGDESAAREILAGWVTVWEQEYQEAARLLEEALEGGFGEAGLLLGDLCRNHAEVLLPVALRGILPGVSRMETERKVGLKEAVPLAAVEYYKRSAELGCGDAMYWLGRSCDEGYGTEKDDAAALSWYFQAKEHGCELMWEELGTCYLIGKGTLNGIPNAPLGIEAFERVLEVGDSNWDDLDSVRVGLALAYAGQCGIKGYKYANFERAKKLLDEVSADSTFYEMAQKERGKLPEYQRKCQTDKQFYREKTKNETALGFDIALIFVIVVAALWLFSKF